MKKIFASDLDQTLIYSGKFVESLEPEKREMVRLIETKDGNAISYMSIKGIRKLSSFAKDNMFIPATTRTIEQYKRIMLFNKEILPRYAVTSNGGNIIIDGEADKDWNEYVKERISKECLSPFQLLRKFDEIWESAWSSEARNADGLFYYFIIDKEKYPEEKMNVFEGFMEESGWQLSVQGRKMYFVPKMVDKWEAVNHIAKLVKAEMICTAGDSKLDLNMLRNADYAIAPLHGAEIAKLCGTQSGSGNKINLTQSGGIFAADEIIKTIAEFVN